MVEVRDATFTVELPCRFTCYKYSIVLKNGYTLVSRHLEIKQSAFISIVSFGILEFQTKSIHFSGNFTDCKLNLNELFI